MMSIRSAATVFGFAAVTTVGTLSAFWPTTTLADDDDTSAALTLDGTKVADDVVVTGTLVRDTKAKTGWVIQVEAENRGTEPATAELETDLTRQTSNPMSRAAPMPTAIFRKKETITIAAGEKVTRRYEVPAGLTPQIAAAANAEAARAKAAEQGKNVQWPRSVTYFGVAFKGPWMDDPAAPTMARGLKGLRARPASKVAATAL